MRLNFASGETLWPGFENSDVLPFSERDDVEHVDLDLPLPYNDDSADLVMISHGLCLRPEKPRILAEFARILRPGGWLRIDDNSQRFYLEDGPRDEHTWHHWPREELRRCLNQLGFDIHEHPPEETVIPESAEVQRALVGNHIWHESFCVEAQLQ